MTLARRKPMKRAGRLNPVSAKKQALDAILAVNSERRRRQANGQCEGPTPACPTQGAHAGVLAHHVRRRKGQADVHAVEHLRWLCWPGHEWVHANVEAARELGLLASDW